METRAPLFGEPLPVELMNTIWADREGGHDALATPEAAGAWLAAVAARTELALVTALADGADLGPVRSRVVRSPGAILCCRGQPNPVSLGRHRGAAARSAGDA